MGSPEQHNPSATQSHRNLSVVTAMVSGVVLLGVAPVALLWHWNREQTKQALLNELQHSMLENVQEAADEIREILSEQQGLSLITTAAQATSDSSNQSLISQLLKQKISNVPYFRAGAYWSSTQGWQITSPKAEPEASQSLNQILTKTKLSQHASTHIIPSQGDQHAGHELWLSWPTKTNDNLLTGMAAAMVDHDKLKTKLKQLRQGEAGDIFILDHQFQIIAASNDDPREHNNASKIAQQKLQKGQLFSHFKNKDGHDYITSKSSIPITNNEQWHVIASARSDQLLSPFIRASKQSNSWLLAIACLAITGAAISGRWLKSELKEISRLLANARAMQIKSIPENETTLFRETHELKDNIQLFGLSLKSFAKFVPKEVVEWSLTHRSVIAPTMTEQCVTVMFCDIIGFTGLSENMGAEGTSRLLSEFFEICSNEIKQSGGIIDKYIGDCVMAVWGLHQPHNEAEHAVSSATRIVQALRRSNHQLNVRIGIHTDWVYAGTLGSESHLNFTVIGDGVNVAARLQEANRELQTTICCSEKAYLEYQNHHQSTTEHEIRAQKTLTIRGREKSVKIVALNVLT